MDAGFIYANNPIKYRPIWSEPEKTNVQLQLRFLIYSYRLAMSDDGNILHSSLALSDSLTHLLTRRCWSHLDLCRYTAVD